MAWKRDVTAASFRNQNPKSASSSIETSYEQVSWVAAGVCCSATVEIEAKTIEEVRVIDGLDVEYYYGNIINADDFAGSTSQTVSTITLGSGLLAVKYAYVSKEESTRWSLAPSNDAGGGSLTQTKVTVTRTATASNVQGSLPE